VVPRGVSTGGLELRSSNLFANVLCFLIDATGQTGGGATAYLWCNGILGTVWFIIVLWLVLVLLADVIW
jgi:hypothetical protein